MMTPHLTYGRWGLRLSGWLLATFLLALVRLCIHLQLLPTWVYWLATAFLLLLALEGVWRGFRPLMLLGLGLLGAGAALGYAQPAWLTLGLAGVVVLYQSLRSQLSERDQAAFWGWVLVAPAVLLLLVWQIIPAVYALWLSFLKEFDFMRPPVWDGLTNYQILLRDPLFWRSLGNTFWFVAFTVPVGIFLGTLLAILLNEKIKFQGFFRTLYFLPYITALTAAAAVWDWIYNPEFGFLNYLLKTPGFDWLSTPDGVFARVLGLNIDGFWAGPSVAFCAVMAMSVWHILGYNVVVLLAGLQNIPKEYYEAASLDGASWWQQQRHITWPLLSPTTFFLFTLGLINSFQVFTQVLILTPTGGLLNDTLTITMYLYNKGFRDSDFSYASALAVVVFVVILFLTVIQRQVLEKRVNYEA